MAGRIPDETLQAVRDRISLVDVVSAYVSLKRTGRNHLGLCPFHNEKTPSFTVSDDRGFFHCFGCGAGGTVFNFLMRIERISFPEAVEQLAKRAGVALPERAGDDRADKLRTALFDVNAKAEQYFRYVFQQESGAAARAYVERRGVRADMLERYALGFAPASGSALSTWLQRQGIAPALAVQAGVLAERDGRVFDRFRGRVMFPIRDRRGRVIAFGGRTLGDDQPKYLNSPESPVFHKGEGLYGLVEARDAIRAADRVVLVEGYMDALMLVQEGVPYAAATLGTALGPAQLRLVRAIAGEEAALFFLFDGDRAGRAAALRAFSVCAEAGVWGRAAFLPEGSDPDSFVREHGAAATLALLESAPPLLDFYIDSNVRAGATLPERTRAVREFQRVLARVRDGVQRELLAQQGAERLGVSAAQLLEGARNAPAAAPVPPPQQAPTAPVERPVEERLLLQAMAADGAVAQWVAESGVLGRMRDRELAAAGDQMATAAEQGRPLSDVVAQLEDDVAALLAGGALAERDPAVGDPRQVAEDCARRIDSKAGRAARQTLHARIRQADRSGGTELDREALAQVIELRRREGEVL